MIKNQLRPFSVAVQPLAKMLAPASADLAKATPNLVRSFGVLNALFNTLAYQPQGPEGLPVLRLVAGPHRRQPDQRPGRAGADRARPVHGARAAALNLFEVGLAHADPPLQPLLALLNAPDWSKIKSSVLPDGEHPVNKQAPSAGKIVTMVAFAASCIGLLLFLWISFGGAMPLAAQGYRMKVEFKDAVQLGVAVRRADLRSQRRQGRHGLAGPPHGAHQGSDPDRSQVRASAGGYARDPAGRSRCSERPTSSSRRARNRRPSCPTEGRSRRARCRDAVNLDQILSTFDPATRQAFSGLAAAVRNCADQPRPGLQPGDRRAVSVRHERRLGAGGAQPRQRRDEHAARETAARCSRR